MMPQDPRPAMLLRSARAQSVLILNDILRIESIRPMPNAWIRFWHRVLLGWRWERL